MRRPRIRTIAIILVIVLAFGLLVSKRLKERKAEKAMLDNTKPSPTRVVGVHPSRQALNETIKAAGSVTARAQVVITPKVSGRIARLLVEEGAYVRPGQLLADIDHTELAAQLAQSEASVASAQAAISQGKINLISAQTDERRMKELIDQKAISQQQYDQAVVRTQLAQQTIQAAQAQLLQAKATVRFNQANLANFAVTAPMSGQITARNVDAGAMAAAGVALFTLAQTGNLRAEFDLPERQLAKLFRGQTVLVSSAAQPDQPVRAKLSEISPVVDPQSRLVKVKVDLPSNGVFRPGLSVDGNFVLVEKPSALAVPLEAVTMSESQASVLVQEDGKVVRKTVTTGIRSLQAIEIVSGLSEADTVIVAGQTFVKPGDPVSVEVAGSTPAAGSDAAAAGSEAAAVPSPSPAVSAKGA
jgi:RND family efflux transporter MFP subunit